LVIRLGFVASFSAIAFVGVNVVVTVGDVLVPDVDVSVEAVVAVVVVGVFLEPPLAEADFGAVDVPVATFVGPVVLTFGVVALVVFGVLGFAAFGVAGLTGFGAASGVEANARAAIAAARVETRLRCAISGLLQGNVGATCVPGIPTRLSGLFRRVYEDRVPSAR
jgi:hypothetical protein